MTTLPPRHAIPRALREQLFLRSSGICERDDCDQPITLYRPYIVDSVMPTIRLRKRAL